MNFSKLVLTLLEEVDKQKWRVKFDGKVFSTFASTKKAALANIGARLAREANVGRELYPRFIQKVLNAGYATVIEEKCWKNYVQRGMKKKGKRIVPNCVKKKAKKTK